MSIELALLRHVETLVQKRITRLERRVSYLHLSPALLKDIGLEGQNVQIAHIREREFQTGFRLGNRIIPIGLNIRSVLSNLGYKVTSPAPHRQ